jgi:hypothetical protein
MIIAKAQMGTSEKNNVFSSWFFTAASGCRKSEIVEKI